MPVFTDGRLIALSTAARGVTTARGIGRGSSTRALRHHYPSARLRRNRPLTGGLSTFLILRSHAHALTFSVAKGRVTAINAFSYTGSSALQSELCG